MSKVISGYPQSPTKASLPGLGVSCPDELSSRPWLQLEASEVGTMGGAAGICEGQVRDVAGQLQTPQNRELSGQLHPHGCVWPMVAGAGSALLGKEGAMACTVAVEESIAQHYNNQIRTLMEEDPEKYEELLQVLGIYWAEWQVCWAQRSRGAHVPLGRGIMGLIQ